MCLISLPLPLGESTSSCCKSVRKKRNMWRWFKMLFQRTRSIFAGHGKHTSWWLSYMYSNSLNAQMGEECKSRCVATCAWRNYLQWNTSFVLLAWIWISICWGMQSQFSWILKTGNGFGNFSLDDVGAFEVQRGLVAHLCGDNWIWYYQN